MKKTKLILVDDHEMIIDGIQQFFQSEDDIELLRTAKNGKEAFDYIVSINGNLDLIITDVNMPEMNGIELTRAVKDKYPLVKVLALSVYKEKDIIRDLLNADADGYILKNIKKNDFLKAVRHIINGGFFYDNEIAFLVEEIKLQQNENGLSDALLSERELEILRLICTEMSSLQIAEKLYISQYTVDTHRKNIIKKTGAKNIVALIKYAIVNKVI